MLEETVELSTADLQYLRDLRFQDLPEPDSTQDAPEVTLVMVWIDGKEQEKEHNKEQINTERKDNEKSWQKKK